MKKYVGLSAAPDHFFRRASDNLRYCVVVEGNEVSFLGESGETATATSTTVQTVEDRIAVGAWVVLPKHPFES